MIREWKFEDILKLSELEKECFSSDFWSYRVFAGCFERQTFYGAVAEENGEIIGFGGISVVADSADLENIFVSEEYRRCGTGTAILNDLLQTALQRGAEKCFLEVRVSNSAALRTYLKCGFDGVYARPRYYSDGEDCLVMQKTLSKQGARLN